MEIEHKLKQCPFCGGNAAIEFIGKRYESEHEWKGYIKACCVVCRASSRGVFYNGKPITTPLDDTESGIKCFEQWNNRRSMEE